MADSVGPKTGPILTSRYFRPVKEPPLLFLQKFNTEPDNTAAVDQRRYRPTRMEHLFKRRVSLPREGHF
jgi:hypothetical protein